ncbi:hypothetical protein, partial [Rickettsia sp. wq]
PVIAQYLIYTSLNLTVPIDHIELILYYTLNPKIKRKRYEKYSSPLDATRKGRSESKSGSSKAS